MKTDRLTLSVYFVQTPNYEIRREQRNGREYMVVPVVMMVPGVHAGSDGPVLHEERFLSQNVSMWDGTPVTVHHPQRGGNYVSVDTPGIREQYQVGELHNPVYRNGLRAEAHIDVQKITAISPEALTSITKGEPLDVSVGVFTHSIEVTGDWNGETYESMATAYQADHLALLPGEQGACGWGDGCGVRVNKEGGTMKDKLQTFKELAREGYVVSPVVNEEGFREISSLLQQKLDAMDTDDRQYYLEEVYSDYFVYRVRSREGGASSLYRRGYTANDGKVEITENPAVEVRRKVDYITASKMRRTKPPATNENVESKEGGKMSDEGKSPCCEDRVDRLIANESTAFTLKDKEWLMTLNEVQLSKLTPVANQKETKKDDSQEEEPVQVNKEEVLDEFKKSLGEELENYTALMPEALKAKVERSVTAYEKHRNEIVERVVANSDIEKEEAEAMPDSILHKLDKMSNTKSGKRPADYSGQGNPPSVNTNGQGDDEDLLLPMEAYKAKNKED